MFLSSGNLTSQWRKKLEIEMVLGFGFITP
jgi:hypothetical protein